MKNARAISVYIALMVVSLSFANPGHAEIDPQTCVGMWLFDEGEGDIAEDSSGNGNDGNIFDGTWVDGKLGKALEFDGVASYVEVKNSDSLNPTEEISICMWIKPYAGMDCDAENNWRYLLNKGAWGSYHIIYEDNGLIRWTVLIEGGLKRFPTAGTYAPDQWSHLVFTYDAKESELRVYANGIEEGNNGIEGAELEGSIDIDTRILKIGGGNNNGCPAEAGFFNGIIDEMAIFNAVLLLDDVQVIMNEGLGQAVGKDEIAVSPGNKLATTWSVIKLQ